MRALLVCGGRRYFDRDRVFAELDGVVARGRLQFDVVRHGAAFGADDLADEWAKARGIPVDPHPADWVAHGRSAGPIRNRAMLKDGAVVGCVAFPGGKGTADMVNLCKAAEIPVLLVK